MLFTGQELSEVLDRSDNEIELRNQYGRCCRVLSRDEALALDPDLFVGIGNLRRIRFLRPREFRAILNAGSHTTQRISDGSGRIIAPPFIRQHRPLRGTTK
jgi:hypothetical protein